MDSLIEAYVDWYNRDNLAEERVYRVSLAQARALDLPGVTRKDIEEAVQPFLYRWGRMGRSLGRPKLAGWEDRLAQSVRQESPSLLRYCVTDFSDADLPLERPHIWRAYESFRRAVGQVAATKCLHLLCPQFFPMWDTTIAGSARRERSGEHVDGFSGEDYCLFVEQVRTFIVRHSAVISDLAKKYDKTKVKIADEILFGATQRPLFFILGTTRIK